MGGKVYAWWLFESVTLKNANTSSYAMFIRTLMKRFGRRNSETHVEETKSFNQTKPLHVMKETIDSKTFQRTMEEADILHNALLESRSSFLAQRGKEIPFSKEDQIIGGLPTHVEGDEGNNAVIYRVDIAPHVEVAGSLALTTRILEYFQGGP